jgi:hypothetical protein
MDVSAREALVLTRAMAGIFLNEDAPLRPELLRKLTKMELGGFLPVGEVSPPEGAVCAFACDPQGGELVRCSVCDRPVCDYHGDYADDEAHAEGDWRCPDHPRGAVDPDDASPWRRE